ncbi:inositol monophosphatase family protein [Streptomyces sp. B6B3]|uniref:inositol monophosphatase family protein n=1 Tax=Streptomyces sp. B6B3 TaxID=3153570 RepID=UPI00325EF594
MSLTDDELLAVAEQAVEPVAEWLGQAGSEWSRQRLKPSGEEVTDADVEVERRVSRALHDRTPDIPVMGEESASSDGVSTASRHWLLDPIDGTANYANGDPFYAVSLALAAENESVLGVIHAPALGLRWSVGPETAHASAPSRARDLSKATVGISGSSGGPVSVGAFLRALHERTRRLRIRGAMSLDLAGVAEGWLDACVCVSPKPWDVAAGLALVRKREGTILGRGGHPFSWNSPLLVAGEESVARELVDLWESTPSASSFDARR